MSKASSERRPYNPGEDMAKWRDRIIVCQGPGRVRGMLEPKKTICGRGTRKVGRYRIAGGWHDVYQCDEGHRFGIKGIPPAGVDQMLLRSASDLSVVDISTAKPVFGSTG